MNGKRAKKMRALCDVFGEVSESPKYDEIRFTRDVSHPKYGISPLSRLFGKTYPVRTLFLVKCKRAIYKRLKRSTREHQDNLMRML